MKGGVGVLAGASFDGTAFSDVPSLYLDENGRNVCALFFFSDSFVYLQHYDEQR